MILGLTLCYGAVKFIDLYEGNDPNVRENSIPDSFGPDDYLTFTDDLNFRLAVGTRFKGEKTLFKFDPQIIKWVALMTSIDDKGIKTQSYFQLHDCTEEDFGEFNPLQEKY